MCRLWLAFLRSAAAASIAGLTGCGTYTPNFEEFWKSDGDSGQKVLNIAAQTSCELSRAIDLLYKSDDEAVQRFHLPPKLKWLDNWGAQVTLTLTVAEQTTLNPGLALNQPFAPLSSPGVFNLGLGANLSSTATRTGIVKMFFTVPQLRARAVGRSCLPSQPAPGYLFVESDLKLKEWIFAAVAPGQTSIADFPSTKDGPFGQNVISHDVKFQVVTGGTVTPSYKLVRVSVNPNAPFLFANRDRTQDLLITLGPLAEKGAKTLSVAAQGTHQAQEIGLAVANSLRN